VTHNGFELAMVVHIKNVKPELLLKGNKKRRTFSSPRHITKPPVVSRII
jgi:hypothetical protein